MIQPETEGNLLKTEELKNVLEQAVREGKREVFFMHKDDQMTPKERAFGAESTYDPSGIPIIKNYIVKDLSLIHI